MDVQNKAYLKERLKRLELSGIALTLYETHFDADEQKKRNRFIAVWKEFPE